MSTALRVASDSSTYRSMCVAPVYMRFRRGPVFIDGSPAILEGLCTFHDTDMLAACSASSLQWVVGERSLVARLCMAQEPKPGTLLRRNWW